MDKSKNKLVNHGAIYAVGNIARNMVSFIMLPIYTTYLTPADYGTIELLSILIDFVGLILGVRLGEAIFRYYCDTDSKQEKDSIIASALFIVTSLNLIGVLLIITFSSAISTLLFGHPNNSQLIELFSWVLLLTAVSEAALIYLRAEQQPVLFIILSLLKLVLQLSLNIYFVVFKDMHVEGVVYSALISGTITTLIFLFYVLSKINFSINKTILSKLINFSFPLMLSSLGSFYLTFGDRFFLRSYHGVDEVGIYSLGYKFGFILLVLVWDPFSKIWDTHKYDIVKDSNAVDMYKHIFSGISIILITFALLISVMIDDFLSIISSPSFREAGNIVPIILLAYLIQAWTSFCNFGILINRKTIYITYGTLLSIITVSILYILLIPEYSLYGAAIATVIAFFVRFFYIYKISSGFYRMHLPWLKIMKLLFLAISVYIISMIDFDDLWMSIIFHSLLLIMYVILLVSLPILDDNEKAIIKSVVTRPHNIKKLFS